MKLKDSFILDQITQSIETKQRLLADSARLQSLNQACAACLEVYQAGGKLLIAGNGGSAADAQHLAAELVSRFFFDRPGLPALALTTDSSILTGIGNDYGFEQLFVRQIEANANKGDVFLAISTSGNSPNILKAIKRAKSMGLLVIGMTGDKGGQMDAQCDICLKAPSDVTPRIQETHILMGHLICAYVEEGMFGGKG